MLANWLFKRKRSLIAFGVGLALAVPLPADASLLWDWSYTSTGIAASGTFATNALIQSCIDERALAARERPADSLRS